MIRVAARPDDPAGMSVPVNPILVPGKNCWRVDPAHRFYCVQDAADYFLLVRQALLDARETVFILGWDLASTIDLAPGVSDGAPTRLDELLAFITTRNPRLRCYILIWDYGALYTLEREPLTRWRLRWQTAPGLRFEFDDRHPVGASHHQKIVVIDDALGFCGGIDLTGHRWDTTAHRVDEPHRTTIVGLAYGPYHEIQAMVDGTAAASLGTLVRERWRALGDERMPPPGKTGIDLWPSHITPDLIDVGVGIVRTMPGTGSQPAIRECEALFYDSIARARHTIFAENQYFTDDRLAAALTARLQEPNGPEVVVVVPKECAGWIERQSMGTFRDAVFRQLSASDPHGRLRLVYPVASRAAGVPTFIHSKVMVVDDELVRIGSANFARRSMGMDTECDLAVEAGGNSRISAGIRHIRNRLLAEHLGMDVDAVVHALAHRGSLCALIDSRQGADRTLLPVEPVGENVEPASEALRATLDPDEPLGVGSTWEQYIPPADVNGRSSPLRLWILPAIVAVAALVASPAVTTREEFLIVREVLIGSSSLPSALWLGITAFILAGLLLVPIELLILLAALALGPERGGLVAVLASLTLAVAGYIAGRAIGADGVARWVSRRSYRSVRQLGAHGIIGVIVLRLSTIAGTGAIHLLCGAGRVPFASYLIGSTLGIAPATVALIYLGGLLRELLLQPTVSNALSTGGVALLLIVIANLARMFLLLRQFAPSVARHRAGAEFG